MGHQKYCIDELYSAELEHVMHMSLTEICVLKNEIANCTASLKELDSSSCSYDGMVEGNAIIHILDSLLNLEFASCPMNAIFEKCKLPIFPSAEEFMYKPALIFQAELETKLGCVKETASQIGVCSAA